MNELEALPNIGKSLALKLNKTGIYNATQLIEMGTENVIIKLYTIYPSDICINLVYAIEGAIQGVRWHSLSKETKNSLFLFYKSLIF